MATQKRSTAKQKSYDGFTEAERDAMKERAKELKSKEDPTEAQLAKIAGMADADRVIAERLHALIAEEVPELTPKLWYGMPGWTTGGKNVCFFQDAAKFKARYATFGFSDLATIDDGDMWPTSYAITELTPAVEKKMLALVKKAVRG
ncbi:iron chaperone [Kribbella sp. NPDC054772]